MTTIWNLALVFAIATATVSANAAKLVAWDPDEPVTLPLGLNPV
jgi:hypothetical protein